MLQEQGEHYGAFHAKPSMEVVKACIPCFVAICTPWAGDVCCAKDACPGPRRAQLAQLAAGAGTRRCKQQEAQWAPRRRNERNRSQAMCTELLCGCRGPPRLCSESDLLPAREGKVRLVFFLFVCEASHCRAVGCQAQRKPSRAPQRFSQTCLR